MANIGGGTKKILYTLKTIQRIGVKSTARALRANNTCKACGLGMGGQLGGMTDESGSFPAVCNKSVQAQSTDIQPPIPTEIFKHTIPDFQQLSGWVMESLGRLNTPLFKAGGSDRYQPISWDDALDYAARKFADAEPERTFFYSSGRASNEAGFVLQLLARLYGTNNVSNCSYYCHQATGVGLANTIGTGTSTVELEDLSGTDLIFVIGANPASNHPRFIYQLKSIRDRGGEVIVINPTLEPGLVKFAVPKSARSMLVGGTEIASHYLQIRAGSDVFLLLGISKSLLEQGALELSFIQQHTQNFEGYLDFLNNTGWREIETATGQPKALIERIAGLYAKSTNTVFAWGMGITHHVHGVENVEAISNLALLRGMVGKRHAGLLPLRGHSNVQGIGTIGVKPVLPEEVFSNIENHLGVTLPVKPGLDTLASLEQAHKGEVDAALMVGGNLYEATPNTSWSETAFNNIGFKLYLTTTLNRGHVHGVDKGEAMILPVTARDEEWQPTTQESMFNYVRLSDGGIIRLDNVRPESTILCELAERLLPKSPFDFAAFKSHNRVREAIAVTVPGMEQIADISVAKKEFHVRGRLLHSPSFNTASGKASFVMPEKIMGSPVSEDYPFLLMSVRSEGQFNSIIYEEKDSYRGAPHRNIVMMNPLDMQNLQFADGDTVILKAPHGGNMQLEVMTYDVPRGNVLAYYPEVNVLIGLQNDPRSKTPAFKSQPVAINPA